MAFFYDPDIPRKSSNVEQALDPANIGVPLPSLVEVSVTGTCNRSCIFCPHSDSDFPDVKKFIAPSLMDKMTRHLNEIGFRGVMLFSGFGEPLLDKKIASHIATARKNMPDAKIELITNGDPLKKTKMHDLFESGLSTLLISVYDGKDEAEAFDKYCREAGLRDDQFVIRHRYLPPEEDFGITLSNRGGAMQSAEFSIASPDEPLKQPCYYPHYMMMVDYEGDVMLCPHDWYKKKIVGNLVKQDLADVWVSAQMNEIRERLAAGNRCGSPCDVCTAQGTLIGEKHMQAWQAFARHNTDA